MVPAPSRVLAPPLSHECMGSGRRQKGPQSVQRSQTDQQGEQRSIPIRGAHCRAAQCILRREQAETNLSCSPRQPACLAARRAHPYLQPQMNLGEKSTETF
jgi:hypothetical protein